VAGNALLIDTDIFIDYLKGILPARALIDSGGFDLYYSAWTRKELLAKPGLRESERREVEALLGRFRILPVDDAIAGKSWTLVKKYDSQGLRQADAIIAATAWQKGIPLPTAIKSIFDSLQRLRWFPCMVLELAVESQSDFIVTYGVLTARQVLQRPGET
jgi:predicted nucleic acid-binding protein